jgi:hypothetical protein
VWRHVFLYSNSTRNAMHWKSYSCLLTRTRCDSCCHDSHHPQCNCLLATEQFPLLNVSATRFMFQKYLCWLTRMRTCSDLFHRGRHVVCPITLCTFFLIHIEMRPTDVACNESTSADTGEWWTEANAGPGVSARWAGSAHRLLLCRYKDSMPWFISPARPTISCCYNMQQYIPGPVTKGEKLSVCSWNHCPGWLISTRNKCRPPSRILARGALPIRGISQVCGWCAPKLWGGV